MNSTNLFDKAYLEHVRKMRTQYFETGSLDGITDVRPEILACWEVAYLYDQSHFNIQKARLSRTEFVKVLKSSEDLLSAAEPYMQALYSFLQKDSFWVTLMDQNGVILKIIASPQMKTVAEQTDLVEGSYRGSDSSYPGLFYICHQLDQPFQIVSTEHPSAVDDIIAGSAAPIHEQGTGKHLGVIGISGYWQNSHDHTLGLTILAAEAIAQQLALRRQNAEITIANQTLNTALEALNSGAVYFRQDGTIRMSNSHAAEMLCATTAERKRFDSGNIFDYLGYPITKNNFSQIETVIQQQDSYSCDLVPFQKYSPLHCTIRGISTHKGEYFMQIQKSSDFNKLVTDTAFPQAPFTFQDIVGQSSSLQAIKDTAEIAAAHSPAVLITGESGTGKEMFAQAIHNSSPRANGPFVAINCGAIPKSLIESELFGYEAGAFTGAQKGGHIGKFELADKGTIFLDEIGDMPYEIQVTLLRVLQSKEVMRIGGKVPIKIDVRVIAATNQNLEKRIADNTFRQDLYYRLNVLNIRLPTLRERLDDIEPLCCHFIEKYGHTFDKKVISISREALDVMARYKWPGNVRELENVIERAVIVCEGTSIRARDLPEQLLRDDSGEALRLTAAPDKSSPTGWHYKEQYELMRLKKVLNQCNGNLSAAAKLLGVSRPTVYRWLNKYGLHGTKNFEQQ